MSSTECASYSKSPPEYPQSYAVKSITGAQLPTLPRASRVPNWEVEHIIEKTET
jgi:hypothetical protein